MKKVKKTLLTAAAFTAALNLAGCDQDYQNVYGPPPDESVMTSEAPAEPETSASEEKPATESTAAESEESSVTSEEIPTSEPPATFKSTENMPDPVYGPPKLFGLF